MFLHKVGTATIQRVQCTPSAAVVKAHLPSHLSLPFLPSTQPNTQTALTQKTNVDRKYNPLVILLSLKKQPTTVEVMSPTSPPLPSTHKDMPSFTFPDMDELDEVFESILANVRLGTANASDWESLAAADRIPNDLPSDLMSMCPEHLRPASWTEPPKEPYVIEGIEGIEEIDEWDIESCRLPLVYDFSEPETCVEEAADLVLWQQKEVEGQETYETLRESWYASLGPENGIRAKV